MKRLLIIPVVLLGLSACGGDDDVNTANAEAPTTKPVEVATTEAPPETTEAPTTTARPACKEGNLRGTFEAQKMCKDGEWVADPQARPTTTTPTTTLPPVMSFAYPVEFNEGGDPCASDGQTGTIQVPDFDDESIITPVEIKCVGSDWHIVVETPLPRDAAVALLGCAEVFDGVGMLIAVGEEMDLSVCEQAEILLLLESDPAAVLARRQIKTVALDASLAVAYSAMGQTDGDAEMEAMEHSYALAGMLREYAALA